MKNIRFFLSENIHVLVVKFSVYLNRHVYVMFYRIFIKHADNKDRHKITDKFTFDPVSTICMRVTHP